MEYEIRNYSSYDDDPRFVVRSDTGNISNISDRMVRLAAKITEIYAGDIFYDIDTLNRVVESGKNHAWLLCLREDGTCRVLTKFIVPNVGRNIRMNLADPHGAHDGRRQQ